MGSNFVFNPRSTSKSYQNWFAPYITDQSVLNYLIDLEISKIRSYIPEENDLISQCFGSGGVLITEDSTKNRYAHLQSHRRVSVRDFVELSLCKLFSPIYLP